jgi:hypothetical protein
VGCAEPVIKRLMLQRLLRRLQHIQRRCYVSWQLYVLKLILRGEFHPRHAPQALQPTSKPGRPHLEV